MFPTHASPWLFCVSFLVAEDLNEEEELTDKGGAEGTITIELEICKAVLVD